MESDSGETWFEESDIEDEDIGYCQPGEESDSDSSVHPSDLSHSDEDEREQPSAEQSSGVRRIQAATQVQPSAQAPAEKSTRVKRTHRTQPPVQPQQPAPSPAQASGEQDSDEDYSPHSNTSGDVSSEKSYDSDESKRSNLPATCDEGIDEGYISVYSVNPGLTGAIDSRPDGGQEYTGPGAGLKEGVPIFEKPHDAFKHIVDQAVVGKLCEHKFILVAMKRRRSIVSYGRRSP